MIQWSSVNCDVNPLLACSQLSTSARLARGGLYVMLRDFLHSGPGESFRAGTPCLPVCLLTDTIFRSRNSLLDPVLAFWTLQFFRRWPDKQSPGMYRLPEYHFHARSALILICFKGEKLSSATETWNSRMHSLPTSKGLAKNQKASNNQI